MLVITGLLAKAQDPLFMLIPSNNSIKNPAISGFNSVFSANIAYRQLYPNVTSFSNYGLNVNGRILKPKIGIGVSALRYYEGNGSLITNSISLSFSKIFPIGHDIRFSLGASAGYLSQSLDFSNKIFSSQLDPAIGYIEGITVTELSYQRIDKIDFSAGGAFFIKKNKNYYLASLSVNHLNMPNISYFEGENYYYPLYYFGSFYSGINLSEFSSYRFQINPKSFVQYQAKSSNIMIGTDFTISNIIFGLGYRNRNIDLTSNISYFGLNFGLNLFNDNLQFMYGYETPILGYPNTGGLHEVGLFFNFINKKSGINLCIK